MYKCSCKEWKVNMKKIDDIFIMAHHRGIKYDGAVFEYCPWCGKELVLEYMKLYPRDYQHNAT